MAFLDILKTFDGIPPLDAILVFSALICLEISYGLTWVNPKDGKVFRFFFNPQYAIVIFVLFTSLVKYLIHCSILVNVCEKRV